MKRITVRADPEDLANIRESARRRGVAAAEIIREGIHMAALANRVWDEPLSWPTFERSDAAASEAENGH